MERTTTQQEILMALAAAPATSSAIAASCRCSTRYARRLLAQLQLCGRVRAKPNPADKRANIYYITTAPTDTHQTVPQKSVPQKIEEQNEEQPQTTLPTQCVPQNKKIEEQIEEHIPDFEEQIEEQTVPQSPPRIPNPTRKKAPFLKTPPGMHSNPQNPPHSHPERTDFEEQNEEQTVPQNHPGTCSLTDHPSLVRCKTCPLTVCELEHDALSFGIIDPFAARFLIQLSKQRGWAAHQQTNNGIWWLYPAAPHPLTLQISADTITVYSSEPGEWIIGWFVEIVGYVHPHPEQLAHQLRHPRIYRDEQTIVITDLPTIEAIRATSAPYADPRNRVEYIQSPNSLTPGLKIYERDGTMRIEFDARDTPRSRSALIMRQELLQILPLVSLQPARYLEWRNQYYNPVTQPVNINIAPTDTSGIIAALDRQNTSIQSLLERISCLETHQKEDNTNDELTQLARDLDLLDEFDLQQVTDLLAGYTGSETSARVYLAAWSIWSGSIFRHPVVPHDVAALFTRQHIPATNKSIADAIDCLITRGLLAPCADHIKFTPAGERIGKRLTLILKQDRKL